jgi:KUP system potassium uptake protein
MDVHRSKGFRNLAQSMVGAIGVVYGDIGTSVLYALHESFFGAHFKLERTEEEVLGVLSFFFWSLLVVVGFKYVLLIMRADNRGEGGIFALLTLINGVRKKLGPAKTNLAWGLIIFGAALLLADGMITPAISVLSSVSGLEVLAQIRSMPGREHLPVVVVSAQDELDDQQALQGRLTVARAGGLAPVDVVRWIQQVVQRDA